MRCVLGIINCSRRNFHFLVISNPARQCPFLSILSILSNASKCKSPRLQQIKIVQFLAVLQDISLYLGALHPGNKVLHAPGNKESRVGNRFRADPDVALLDELDGRLHRLSHAESGHHHGKAAAAEGGHGHRLFDFRKFGASGRW